MKELEEKFAECIARFGSTLNSNEIRNLATDLVSLLPVYGSQPNKWGLTAEMCCNCGCHKEGQSKGWGRLEKTAQLIGHFDSAGEVSCCNGTDIIIRILTNDEVGELVAYKSR